MTVVLAYFILKEVIQFFDGAVMGINLAAILLTILGASSADNNMVQPPVSILYYYALMVVNPFFSAGGYTAFLWAKKVA